MKLNIDDNDTQRDRRQSKTKLITNVSKKLENVEYLMKIEKNNKKMLEDKYNNQMNKIESQVEKIEKELEYTLRELNEKEANIFEIQKNKLEEFKSAIQKYENVLTEIDEKIKSIEITIEYSELDEDLLYNQSNMFYEDYLSFNHEIFLLKRKVIELKNTLNEIERTYPKKFEFLLEDIHLEKELNEITAMKKQNTEEIKLLEKNKRSLVSVKEGKMVEMQNLQDDIKHIQNSFDIQTKDENLRKLEELIAVNINDLVSFEKNKILIQNFYSQKNFDLENELNVILIKNLGERLKEMKNEFVLIKNEKSLQKSKIESSIEDMRRSKTLRENPKIEKEISSKQSELDRINNEMNLLELNCKKKETLFNKYIIVLRNKCKKSAQESYLDMNPALIIETEFEEKLKEEILRSIDSDRQLTEDDKLKNKNLIEIYFKELSNREKILQSYLMKKKKNEEQSENINKEIEKLEEAVSLCEGEIATKKSIINDLIQKEKIFIDKIEVRNRSLTINLEHLGEEEFEKYLKSNEQILKNMKKVYGNKVLDKVFKVQKQKLLESVIMDHSHKKSKVNEYVHLITKSEGVLAYYNYNLNELEGAFKIIQRKYEDVIGFTQEKNREKNVLVESQRDLKDNMESILQGQFKEIESDKKRLKIKYNTVYYIEKVKDLNGKLDELYSNKEKLIKEFEGFNLVIHEKERILHLEDLDLKNNLISLSMGVNGDNKGNTPMPYKINKSYREEDKYNNKYLEEEVDTNRSNDKEEDFNEIIEKSLYEFKIRSKSPEDEEIIGSDDERSIFILTNSNELQRDGK